MANVRTDLVTFNRGIISELALARTDIKRVLMSATEQTNWISRVLGPMSLRPGLQYLQPTEGNKFSFHLPFVFAIDDTALLQLTDYKMRVLINDEVVTREAVGTSVTNGTFNSDLTGWTDNDEAGATSSWVTGGYMGLASNGTANAIRDQSVSVDPLEVDIRHALRIEVERGDVALRVGTSAGGGQLIAETVLRRGVHSLSFVPGATTVYIRLSSRTIYTSLVSSVTIESGGPMEIDTPWPEAELENIRFEQSGDVIFCACGPNIRPIRIERRGATSWSVVDYLANAGPFRSLNITSTTMTPSALSGDVTITASNPTFTVGNVGGLIAIESLGQSVTVTATAQNTFSNEIRVTGIGESRRFALIITGLTGTSSTVTLQRSVGAPGAWTDVTSYTADQSTTYLDALDNQIIYYRIGVGVGDYSSGTIEQTLAYSAGSIRGVARIVGYTSETQVTAIVLSPFGATTPSPDWYEGAWSPRRGYPSAVALYEGRLAWAGKDKIDLSVSDDFSNFDDTKEGDSGPILRSIGAGPVDQINWLVPAQLLLMGGQGSEFLCRSSTLGEPLTPTNFNLKEASSRGSLRTAAVKVDASAIFVDRSGARVYELEFDSIAQNYTPVDLTSVVPELALAGVRRIAVQRRPDTRLHFVMNDGTVLLLVYDKAEEVTAWLKLETRGAIEDAVVLPGFEEDRVYYSVRREINGNTVRYLEKFALQSECEGGEVNKQADAFVELEYESPTDVVTGLDHLEGEEVVLWADGGYVGSYTVESGGFLVGTTQITHGIVGLPYTARYRSSKLNRMTRSGPEGLGAIKRMTRLSLCLYKTHAQGLRFGTSFDKLDDMPTVEDWEVVAQNRIWDEYEQESIAVNGTFETDTRLCLEAHAPKPCTVLAAIVEMEENG